MTEVFLDPRNPDVMFATTYQRRRAVWTLIDGGPESGMRKSTDGGKTWRKITNGLPKVDMGRIGMAISPAKPDTMYAIIEAAGKESGMYRSVDGGENWEKRSDYVSTSPQAYNEIVADPNVADRVYSMDTWMHVSDDGAKTMRKVGEKHKHVDNHALWIDPADSDHLLAGCDGGVYESWDRGGTWKWSENLPLSQFYKVGLDNATPFYNIYGGTQDNNSIGGPSRNRSANGIVNSDWFIMVEGDGFQPVVDPTDPNIVYAESQHAGIARFDKRTGETVDIQPQADANDPPLRWNWDTPLLISPHNHTRLYLAAQRLFRSDDRGNTWTPVSPDLTRQINRNELPLMGRVWGPDTVAKNASTSFYGNIVALSESTKKEGLLAVGTDDGLIQISEDGGKAWRKIEKFPGVPDRTYVSRVLFSQHDANTMYASFDNHKTGDFKPYVFKSTDLGKSWTAITGDLPERGSVYAVVEDPVKPDLLFAGAEFGVYFTPDGGKRWIQLKGGMPTIQVRDLAIQKREGDLVAATFGRGFYVLDDYSPLRAISDAELAKDAVLFPVKQAFTFAPTSPFGGTDAGSNGDQFYTAPNPPLGAVFTYYLKDELKTRAKTRQEAEKEQAKKNADSHYPSWDDLKRELREEAPTCRADCQRRGRQCRAPDRGTSEGRHPASDLGSEISGIPVPTDLTTKERDPWDPAPVGPLVAPGKYRVALAERIEGKLVPKGEPQTFEAAPLGGDSLPPADRPAMLAFQIKTGNLQRAVLGAVGAAGEAQTRLNHLKKALADTPRADPALQDQARAIETRLKDIQESLSGDPVRGKYQEPTRPNSISDRVNQIVSGHWNSTADATTTHKRNYEIAAKQFAPVLEQLRPDNGRPVGRWRWKMRQRQQARRGGPSGTPGTVPPTPAPGRRHRSLRSISRSTPPPPTAQGRVLQRSSRHRESDRDSDGRGKRQQCLKRRPVLHRFHVSELEQQLCYRCEFASSNRRRSSPVEYHGADHQIDSWRRIRREAVYKNSRLRPQREVQCETNHRDPGLAFTTPEGALAGDLRRRCVGRVVLGLLGGVRSSADSFQATQSSESPRLSVWFKPASIPTSQPPHAMSVTVCLSMIVKNEAPVIRRCLDSVRPIIDYWVIVDTGSTDGTQDIIREHLKDVAR